MVRKKAQSSKKVKPFAPAGKLLMIERNRSLASPIIPSTSKLASGLSVTPSKTPRNEKMNSTTSPKSEKKKKKFRRGMKAIREIKKYQSKTSLLVPKASFSRVVREIMQESFGKGDYRFTSMAMMALQEATEMAIVNLLEVANLCCIHAKRVTLAPSDIRLTRRAFGLGHPVNE